MVDVPTDSFDELPRFAEQRFFVISGIGSGGHATVLQAWDRQLERQVACKVSLDFSTMHTMSPEVLAAIGITDSTRAAFDDAAGGARRYTPLREARLLALVEHPNVIPVIDVGLFQHSLVALVMPYMEGGTLEGREFAEPWQDVLNVALQIGRGLAAIHDAGILHRDLKPNNILFGGDGRPFVADLGLACRIDDAVAMADRVGTEDYMAPEVMTRGFLDVRDDLYAYCMIVYEMFYGHSPFATMEDRERGRVSISTRASRPPRELDKILARGLAPDADRRWPNMKALLQALEQVRKPARQKLPWVTATLGIAAAVSIGFLVSARPVHADACEDAMSELEPIWNDAVRTELRGAMGTRKAGDGLDDWAGRWLVVRAEECAAAKSDARETGPTPCSASLRDRFQATIHTFRTPHLREGLSYATVIAKLPDPDHCIDHPDDAEWGYGGLLELRDIDVEVDALVGMGDLEIARARQHEYMKLAEQLRSEYGVARAIFWRGEIFRLEGQLVEAAEDFELAYGLAWELGLGVFGAEVQMKLAAVAGARGEIGAVDAYALTARAVFAEYQPDRVAELLQVQGLALVAGPETVRERGVELLLRAVEMREGELQKHRGTRELLSEAHESYARGLLVVDRAGEAIEYLELALRVHEEEFGHGTWRVRWILQQKFRAQIALRHSAMSEFVGRAILKLDADAGNWPRYTEDAFWLAAVLEQAGYLSEAILPLREGRAKATEHGLTDDVVRFDRKIEQLTNE